MTQIKTHMKSSEEHRICPFRGFFRCLPELFLGRVSVHRTYSKKAVSKLFRNIWKITRLRANHHSVIDKPEEYEEDMKEKEITFCDASQHNNEMELHWICNL